MGKRERFSLHCLSSWCLVIVVWLLLTIPWICLKFVIVVFPDHTHLLFLLTRTVTSFLRYTGYINVTKDPISHVLLLILIHLLLLSRLYLANKGIPAFFINVSHPIY